MLYGGEERQTKLRYMTRVKALDDVNSWIWFSMMESDLIWQFRSHLAPLTKKASKKAETINQDLI